METVRTKFFAALQELQIRGGVLVALSGGADSVCLLDLFSEAKRSGIFPYAVAAAHLNHNLRGTESERDEIFCKRLCAEYGIPLYTKSVDIAALAKHEGKCIEEAARDARYTFLEDLLGGDLCYIATAHHQGDFCETMLLNLVRGTGIDGLRSIPRVRGKVLRPLLDCSREEILRYNKARELDFVTDSTNRSVEYSRNRIRLHVLPEFAAISAGYADSMVRTAALLSQDADYLSAEAKKAYERLVKGGVLDTKRAQNLHPALLSRVIKTLYNTHGASRLAEVHIDAISSQIQSGKEDFSLSVPGGVCLCERGLLSFVGQLPQCENFCLPVEIGKPLQLPNGITVLLSESETDGTPLRADALCGRLTVRSRKEGDTIRQFGKTHKIKRMIADKKLSAAEKAKLIFLCADDTVLYTNLPAVSDRAFPKSGSGPCIFIKTEENI